MKRVSPGLLVFVSLGAFVSPLHADVPVACAFAGSGGAALTHGIVVPDYGGNNVRSVQLAFSADTPGFYGIQLTIHRNAFNGPQVGAPTTVYLSLAGTPTTITQTFDFGRAPVTPGDALALSLLEVQGPGNASFDTGSGGCSHGNAYDTSGKTPPLDTQLNGVGIGIIADTLITTCVASDTLACLDDSLEDQRFEVTIHYATVEGGGRAGEGQAIATSSLGVNSGGMFWFFTPNNPEILVKVVNGCAVNQKYWVFYSADTNVGFNVKVHDTITGQEQSYTNQDLHAATPVQDTSALPCGGGPA